VAATVVVRVVWCRAASRECTTWRLILTDLLLLVVCIFGTDLNGRVVTARRSSVGRTPDGGTATGAGGVVVRTPDGRTEVGSCATTVELGVCPKANNVSLSSPMPIARQDTPFFIAAPISLEPMVPCSPTSIRDAGVRPTNKSPGSAIAYGPGKIF
jgi:hypothetical protein